MDEMKTATVIEEASVGDLRSSLDRAEFTVHELVQSCLDRIEAMDRRGVALHAVIETNPDALAIADEMDAELRDGRSRGLLHGIPVLLKDNIATADRMQTTAGSLALEGATPRHDAFIVSRLRDAGAVILGKANLSEWANIRDGLASSGWSARGGQTLNPYQLDRTASGSSSGSAVAVAASYVPLAVGTETNGSICSPSGTCGIVGIKPTVGLVSRSGIIPITQLQDTAGPMTRNVTDAAILLNALAGFDPDEPAQRAEPLPGDPRYPARPEGGLPRIDYTQALDRDGLRGARIGVWREPLSRSDATMQVFDCALDALREAGAELVHDVHIPSTDAMRQGRQILNVMLWNLKADIGAYLQRNIDPSFPIQCLADIVAFNREHAHQEMPWFGQDIFEMALDKGSLDDPDYLEMVATVQRWGREEGIDAVLEEHRLDAIVSPANGPASRIDLVNGDRHVGGSSTPSAIAGYPIVTVPAGYYAGLPIGLNFMAGAYSEEMLIRLAYSFEQATGARRPPTYASPGVLPPEPARTA
jgi:amidase